jgi:hypothetical protein
MERTDRTRTLLALVALFSLLIIPMSPDTASGQASKLSNRRGEMTDAISEIKTNFLAASASGHTRGTLLLNDGTPVPYATLTAKDGLLKMEMPGGNKLIIDERLVDFRESLARIDKSNSIERWRTSREDISEKDDPIRNSHNDRSLMLAPEENDRFPSRKLSFDLLVTLDGQRPFTGLGFDIVYDKKLLAFEDGAFTGSADTLLSGIHDMGGTIIAGGIGMEERSPVGNVLRLTFSFCIDEEIPDDAIRLVRSSAFSFDGTEVPGITFGLPHSPRD